MPHCTRGPKNHEVHPIAFRKMTPLLFRGRLEGTFTVCGSGCELSLSSKTIKIDAKFCAIHKILCGMA